MDELYTELFNFSEQREYAAHADFNTDLARVRSLQQKRPRNEPTEEQLKEFERRWQAWLRSRDEGKGDAPRPSAPASSLPALPAWLKSKVF